MNAQLALPMLALTLGGDAEILAGRTDGAPAPPRVDPPGMVWVPPGAFTMGWDGVEGRPDERPAHHVSLHGYWIDRTEVTNAQFAQFVEATGYLTTAERPIDWDTMKEQVPAGTPKPPEELLQPGSVVFTPPGDRVDLRDVGRWWTWTPGASWRQPEGPGSSVAGRMDEPVVHVSWDDANAYAHWAGKRLPTEAEWERAARAGHDASKYMWGEELTPGGTHMANIWQGQFPHRNSEDDGYARAAPVGSFPPNALGLYDMAGNVWEWTADRFRSDTYEKRLESLEPGATCENPLGPDTTADPRHPFAADSRVQKGGSFLCHASYCESYRPSAKMATPPDSGMSHLGFRCVSDAPPPNSSDAATHP